MHKKNYKTGVIGLGFIGIAHIEALRRLGFVNVIAISETVGAKEKSEELFVENYYNDYKDMIDSENLDVIHICTPNHTHYEIAKYAMDKGIHVVCEKPMTATLEDAVAMAELAKKTNLINAVNFHNRFYPMTNHIKTLIKNDDIGDVISVHGEYIQDWLLYDTDYSWRLVSDYSGKTRAIADIGSHWMDLIQFTTGLKITEVFAEFSTFYPERKKAKVKIETFSEKVLKEEDYEKVSIDTEDFAVINLKLENGAICSGVISQMFAGEKNKITLKIAGKKASVTWDSNDLNNLTIGHRGKPNEFIQKDASLLKGGADSVASYPGGHIEGFPDAFKQTFKKVYESISNPSVKEYATFEDGLNQTILAEKLFESSNKKTWIKI